MYALMLCSGEATGVGHVGERGSLDFYKTKKMSNPATGMITKLPKYIIIFPSFVCVWGEMFRTSILPEPQVSQTMKP